ncbi:MAG: HD domain-containing protein [Phycisphaeraceae bacterium]|nr:HD domain-containing protein [Phycisphaeraceae bacterium]MCW5755130.1 HD domain-containing protein [Phycisphaeraceae bacterium]
MTNNCSSDSRADPYRLARERCRALGLPVWRANAAGMLIEEPADAGLVGLWLRSGGLALRVSRAIADFDGQIDPPPSELFDGCWLISLAETRRRRVQGYTVAMVLGPQALSTPDFEAICRTGQLDPAATRRTMRAIAKLEPGSVRHTAQLLRWMLTDLRRLAEDADTIGEFTGQLSSAYETIDLLYSLGREMNEPNEPEQFVQRAIHRLHESLDFAWVAAIFVDDPRLAPVVNSRMFLYGQPTMSPLELECAIRNLIGRMEEPNIRHIISDATGFEPDGGPQIVVQPVLRDAVPAGFLLAGEKGGIDPQVSSYDTHALEAAAGCLGPFLENAALYVEQQAMFMGTLKALTSAIDAKDKYTCGHSERVAYLAGRLAEAHGLPREQVERIHIAGLVHDVGKIGVPEEVLGKAGRLTDEEFDAIKLHPEIGHRILRDIPSLQDVLPGVLHHHERWDGRGYPHGLAGEQIPLSARIIGLVDTFDAMSSTRSYRPAMSRDQVLAEIQRCAGSQFDPALVPLFLGLELDVYDEMVASAAPQGAFSSRVREAA